MSHHHPIEFGLFDLMLYMTFLLYPAESDVMRFKLLLTVTFLFIQAAIPVMQAIADLFTFVYEKRKKEKDDSKVSVLNYYS